ncbi:MAG: hypothetical protein JST65_22900 [Acidobacteria bacterium]|nr:hypothetical protein [Acidobacteriota bacterium]
MFLSQLEKAEATSWQCPCGCASIDFQVDGAPPPEKNMNILADFIFGTAAELNGIFIYEQGGVLAGLEVTGYTGDAPKNLPQFDALRPMTDAFSQKDL